MGPNPSINSYSMNIYKTIPPNYPFASANMESDDRSKKLIAGTF